MRRPLLVATTVVLLLGAACGGGSSAPDVAAVGPGAPRDSGDGGAAGQDGAGGPGTTRVTDAAGPGPVGEPGRAPVDGDARPRARAGQDPALLRDVRAAGHEGFDRVVVELSGAAVPSYGVAPIEPPISLEDSDDPAPVAGESFLEIRLAPSGVLASSGVRSYQGPDRVPVADGGVVTEVVRVAGTGSGELVFAVGLDAPAPFGVEVQRDPARLVVDIVHGG